MEQDPLVCVAEVEQLADFIGGEAIDVAQGDDLALCRRQLGRGGADVRVQLVGKQLLFGPVYTTDDGSGAIQQTTTTTQPAPPESGIPS